jgi:hypothetical protein
MLKMSLAAILTIGAIGAAQAADTKVSVDAPTVAGCRAARTILADHQRIAVDGTFHFVDGDNMVCFRPPQQSRLVLKPALEAAHETSPALQSRVPLPRPNIIARQPLPPPPSPWVPGPNVAGDGLPVRGTLAFKTGHTVPLTQTRELGTRIGGNLTQDRVSFNSFEVRLAQRF